MSCPICTKDTVQKYKPFCSKRCADVDLGKWLNGSYAIPAAQDDMPDEDEIIAGETSSTHH
ncbi:MAG: DNA gyrase inhibitor YacG [Paracoccaceae bacterium]